MRLGKLALVLLYFVAVAVLAPRALSWDALGFLLHVRAQATDYGHALYAPTIRAADALLGGLASSERAARLLSALGASLAFFLLWVRAERAGASSWGAPVAAALFATTPRFWYEAGNVEPSTWTVAALLMTAEAAEGYGRERTLARMALLALAFGLALGFHLVSLCALPWLVWLAAGPAPRPPLGHAAIPLALAAAALALAAFGRLDVYWAYWSGFWPRFEGGVANEVALHVGNGWSFLLEGAPVLAAQALVCAPWLVLGRRRRALGAVLALSAPYLLAYAFLGKPLVGLLLPALLALGLLIGEAAGAARGLGRLASGVLGFALLLQLAITVAQAVRWTRESDVDGERAALLARALPRPALLLAGKLANQLRYRHPEVPVVALPELLHEALGRDRAADPIEVVRRELERAGAIPCYLSSDGFAFLQGILAVDPYRLGLDEKGTRFFPEDPKLCLIPIVGQ